MLLSNAGFIITAHLGDLFGVRAAPSRCTPSAAAPADQCDYKPDPILKLDEVWGDQLAAQKHLWH